MAFKSDASRKAFFEKQSSAEPLMMKGPSMKSKIPMAKESMNPKPDTFELDHMASKLMDAEEIKNDPKKMAMLTKHLKKKVKTIKSIQGLRDKRKQLQEEKTEPMDNAQEEGME